MTIREVAVGGVWAASAVGVAGWTWQAFTSQKQAFPAPGDAGGGSGGSANAIEQWVQLATNPFAYLGQKLAQPLINPIRKLFGSTPSRGVPAPGSGGAPAGIRPRPGR